MTRFFSWLDKWFYILFVPDDWKKRMDAAERAALVDTKVWLNELRGGVPAPDVTPGGVGDE